jgi:ubiquinone/menaquinone biosynthesis C-methylase UbiE
MLHQYSNKAPSRKTSTKINILEKRLNLLEQYFQINKFKIPKFNIEDIVEYFSEITNSYLITESSEGALHFNLSFTDSFSQSGFEKQPYYIKKIIGNHKAKKVLELGSGEGFNINYLAQNLPTLKFSGIDVTPSLIEKANIRKAKLKLSNVLHKIGDFNSISKIENGYDMIFMIDSLRYHNKPLSLIKKIYNKLPQKGIFFIVDVIGKKDPKEMDEFNSKSTKIFSKALHWNYIYLGDLKSEIKSQGFTILEEVDWSEAVWLDLIRKQKKASVYFDDVSTLKVLSRILPSSFWQNTISNFILPEMFANETLAYRCLVCQKL